MPKRKRMSKKDKQVMEGLSNGKAAKIAKKVNGNGETSTTSSTTATEVKMASGSVMYLQQRQQEEGGLSSESKAILDELTKNAQSFDMHIQHTKRKMISDAAHKMKKQLIKEGREHLVCRISEYLTRALKPIKGFVTDRYVQMCLGQEFKNPDQRDRAISGRNTSADKKQMLATKHERAHDTKGATDYTLEEIDGITNIEILRDIAKHYFTRAKYLENQYQKYGSKLDELDGLRREFEAKILEERNRLGRIKAKQKGKKFTPFNEIVYVRKGQTVKEAIKENQIKISL